LGLQDALNNKESKSTFTVSSLIPNVLRLSSDNDLVPLPNPSEDKRGTDWQDCDLTILNSKSFFMMNNQSGSNPNTTTPQDFNLREWWSLRCGNKESTLNSRFYTISSRFFQITTIASVTNILGLYIGIVYTVGRILRIYFVNRRVNIVYYSMPVTKHLRRICDVSIQPIKMKTKRFLDDFIEYNMCKKII
jgi:hypothetical protein